MCTTTFILLKKPQSKQIINTRKTHAFEQMLPNRVMCCWHQFSSSKHGLIKQNSSDAGDGIFWLWGQYHARWSPSSPCHQNINRHTQMAKFMGPTWSPPGTCRPQMGPCWPHEPCYQGSIGCAWHTTCFVVPELISSNVTLVKPESKIRFKMWIYFYKL